MLAVLASDRGVLVERGWGRGLRLSGLAPVFPAVPAFPVWRGRPVLPRRGPADAGVLVMTVFLKLGWPIDADGHSPRKAKRPIPDYKGDDHALERLERAALRPQHVGDRHTARRQGTRRSLKPVALGERADRPPCCRGSGIGP